jgi:hypothetical protein
MLMMSYIKRILRNMDHHSHNIVYATSYSINKVSLGIGVVSSLFVVVSVVVVDLLVGKINISVVVAVVVVGMMMMMMMLMYYR